MRSLILQPEYKSIFNLMDEMWDRSSTAGTRFSPPAEWTETDKGIDLELEVPGVRPEEIKLTTKDGYIRVEGEKKYEKSDKNHTRTERYYGQFVREFSVPDHVDLKAAEASFENGVLRVHLPKIAEALPRTIEIKKLT